MSVFVFEKTSKNILDLFTFDLTTFFQKEDYHEVNCIEESGVFMIEYEKNILWTEFDLFKKVIFRVFNDKNNFEGSSHINVCFPAKKELINKTALKNLVDSIVSIYQRDDENQGMWNDNDEENFNNALIDRLWTRGEGKNIYNVRLTYEKNSGLMIKILFFNHLLNLINKS